MTILNLNLKDLSYITMSDSSSISSGNNKITIDKNIKNNILKTGYKNNRIKILTTDNFILDGIPIKKKK